MTCVSTLMMTILIFFSLFSFLLLLRYTLSLSQTKLLSYLQSPACSPLTYKSLLGLVLQLQFNFCLPPFCHP